MGGRIRSLAVTGFQTLGSWIDGWERGRFVNWYKGARDRLLRSPSLTPSSGPDLDLYFFVSLLLHLILALLLYALSPVQSGAVVQERPPISVSLVDLRVEAAKPALSKAGGKEARKPRALAALPQKPLIEEERPPAKPLPEPKAITAPRPASPFPEPKLHPLLIEKERAEGRKSPRSAPEELVKGLEVAPISPPTPVEPTGLAGPKPVGGGKPAPAPEVGRPSLPSEIARLSPSAGGPPSGGRGAAPPKELVEGALGGFQGLRRDVKIPERLKAAGSGGGRPSGLDLIDTSDPDFTEYFEKIKKRVYAAWRYPKGVEGMHKLSLRFRLDQAGGAHDVQVVSSTNPKLDESAVQAMNRASPFPPIPEKFKALVGQPLILIFTVTIQ
ncbi:MAG: TonB family protein [Candidatus Methylomirabilales bacterium]